MQKAFRIFLILMLVNVAQAAPIPAGEYLTEHSWGKLTIFPPPPPGNAAAAAASSTIKSSAPANPAVPVKQRFVLNASGANGQSCYVKGEIVEGESHVSGFNDAVCEIKFAMQNQDLDVSSNHTEVCRSFCGMRASFEGVYLKPDKQCEIISRNAARGAYKKLYDKQDYAQAEDILQTLQKNCSRMMDLLEVDHLRNDLALAQFKSNQSAACLQTLEPLAADARRSDQDVLAEYANTPADGQRYLSVVRVTRKMLEMCGKTSLQSNP